MKLMIASDLHGSAAYTRRLLELDRDTGCQRLVLVGDLLYHVEGVENYRFTAPAADVAADDTVLPVLGALTVTEMEA